MVPRAGPRTPVRGAGEPDARTPTRRSGAGEAASPRSRAPSEAAPAIAAPIIAAPAIAASAIAADGRGTERAAPASLSWVFRDSAGTPRTAVAARASVVARGSARDGKGDDEEGDVAPAAVEGGTPEAALSPVGDAGEGAWEEPPQVRARAPRRRR